MSGWLVWRSNHFDGAVKALATRECFCRVGCPSACQVRRHRTFAERRWQMRARRFASRERRQFIEDDLMLVREATMGGHTGQASEPSEGSADVMRMPSLSVKLGDLVELG